RTCRRRARAPAAPLHAAARDARAGTMLTGRDDLPYSRRRDGSERPRRCSHGLSGRPRGGRPAPDLGPQARRSASRLTGDGPPRRVPRRRVRVSRPRGGPPMSSPVVLDDLPIVDAHCHGWRNEGKLSLDPDRFLDRITLTGSCLTASADGRALTSSSEEDLYRLTDHTPFALAMKNRLAALLRSEASGAELGRARNVSFAADESGYLQALWADAGVAGLFVDDGSPPIPSVEMQAEAHIPVYRVARIERWIQNLRDE